MNLNKHSKVRTVGLSSSFALLALLGLAVFCPSSNDMASAAETSSATFELDFILQKTSTATFAIDFLLAQQLSISMGDLPASTTASVQPTSSGAQTSAYQDFSVSTNSTSGLGIFVYGEGGNTLVDTADANNTIPSITANSSLTAMPTNTWGYDLSEGAPAASSLTFKPVPATKGAAAQTTSNTTTDKAYRLTFGANVDLNKAPGTYSRTVNVQVVPNSTQTTAISEAAAQADTPEGQEYLQSLQEQKEITE